MLVAFPLVWSAKWQNNCNKSTVLAIVRAWLGGFPFFVPLHCLQVWFFIFSRQTTVICDTGRDSLTFKVTEEVLPIVILYCTNKYGGIGKLLKPIEMLALARVVGPANEIIDKIVTKCVECKL